MQASGGEERHWVWHGLEPSNPRTIVPPKYSTAEWRPLPRFSFARCGVGQLRPDVTSRAKRDKLSGSPAKPAKHGRLSLARAASHSRRSALLVLCPPSLRGKCTHDDQTLGRSQHGHLVPWPERFGPECHHIGNNLLHLTNRHSRGIPRALRCAEMGRLARSRV